MPPDNFLFCLFCCHPRVLGLPSHFAALSPANTLANTPHGPSCGQTLGTSNGAHTGMRNTRQQGQNHTAAPRHPRSLTRGGFEGARKSRARFPGTGSLLQGGITQDNGSQTKVRRAAAAAPRKRRRRPSERRGSAGRLPAGPGALRRSRLRRVRQQARTDAQPRRARGAEPASLPTAPGAGRGCPVSSSRGKEGGGRESLTVRRRCVRGQPAEAARHGKDGERERKCRKCPAHTGDAVKRGGSGSRSCSSSHFPSLPRSAPAAAARRRPAPPHVTGAPRAGPAPRPRRRCGSARLPPAPPPAGNGTVRGAAARRISPT